MSYLSFQGLLISWLLWPSAVILEPNKIKSITAFTFSPSICYKVMRPEAMILVLWMLSFKPTFSLSSFTLIKRLCSSSSLSAFRVVSVYLSLLIFLPAILILACYSSSLAFLMMCYAYKLNRQWQYTALLYSFPSFEPINCSMSGSNCYFVTHIQVSQETGKVVWYSHLFKNFPVCCDSFGQRLYRSQRSRGFSVGIIVAPITWDYCED